MNGPKGRSRWCISGFKGKFAPVGHFFGYEGRSAYPTNFDANYCYALGFTASRPNRLSKNGLDRGALKHLHEPATHWIPIGVPLTAMMGLEMKKGKEKAVITKALVYLNGEPFKYLEQHRQKWATEDHYQFPGLITIFWVSLSL